MWRRIFPSNSSLSTATLRTHSGVTYLAFVLVLDLWRRHCSDVIWPWPCLHGGCNADPGRRGNSSAYHLPSMAHLESNQRWVIGYYSNTRAIICVYLCPSVRPSLSLSRAVFVCKYVRCGVLDLILCWIANSEHQLVLQFSYWHIFLVTAIFFTPHQPIMSSCTDHSRCTSSRIRVCSISFLDKVEYHIPV